MQELSFIREWNERAGFVAAIAMINPILITAHVLFYYKGPVPFDFWLIGIGLTMLVCLIVGLTMFIVILLDRKRRAEKRRKQLMWENVMPYSSPVKAMAQDATNAHN